METMIIFSHLRWNFVFQRPQHLLTRLSKNFKIYFIEEPVFHDSSIFFDTNHVSENLTVLTPRVPTSSPGFHDDHLPYIKQLISEYFHQGPMIVWFYTPMALPLLQELSPKMIVFDCMDQLSAFANPPKQLLQRENALFTLADLVFTGGPSLYEEKKTRHPNVHCFPSSVEIAHFEKAKIHIPVKENTPVIGFYGVIDERFDYELIGEMAQTKPDWKIELIGPVLKINPELLPKTANIQYLGQKSYSELPDNISHWDICLLPFALNESTRFISPTKTLEYMAAGKPIVSTRIKDVVDLYGSAVSIATTYQEFIDACEDFLHETEQAKQARIERAKALLNRTSWDETANSMLALINQHLKIGGTKKYKDYSSFKPKHLKNIIIGAGPTGLSAAYHLGPDTLLVDKNPAVGGWCRSIKDKGFTFDYAGHIMFSNDEYVQELYKILLGNNLHWQDREAWVYSKSVYTRYPFQSSLNGLPKDVIKECILGATEARYGEAPKPLPQELKSHETTKGDSIGSKDCCADGTEIPMGEISLPLSEASKCPAPKPEKKSQNFEDFIYKVWGKGIARHFAIPYNKKLWTVPLTEMETSWLGGRVPLPNLEEIIEGALSPQARPVGPNARFGYPLEGGFQALMDGFLPLLTCELQLNAEAVEISISQKTVKLSTGKYYRYENLISTMPLPHLIDLLKNDAPEYIQKAAKQLKHVSIRCVNLGIGRDNITDKHWIYYPEDTIFHRIFAQGNASPNCNPKGGFGLTCEISYSATKPLPYSGTQLIERCIKDCIAVGIINADDRIITSNEVDMPIAYVIYDHARAKNVEMIKAWLAGFDIHLAGRYSEWEYYNSDHAFLAGKRVAERCLGENGILVNTTAN